MDGVRRALRVVFLIAVAFMMQPAKVQIDELPAKESQKHYSWDRPPTIVMCYNDFPMYLLYRAVDFWEMRGKEIEGIIPSGPNGLCAVDYIPNTIIVRRAQYDQLLPDQLAITRRMSDENGKMVAAVIIFKQEKLHYNLIIEHELGHALGYGHVNKHKHIMNPYHERMGLNFWIP